MPTLSGLADVVASLGTPEQVFLERTGPVTVNAEGVAVSGAVIVTELEPKVFHPTSGRDRTVLPEGYRVRETHTMFSTTPLRSVTEDGDDADVLIRRSSVGVTSRHVVVVVEDWSGASGHYRVFVSREATK